MQMRNGRSVDVAINKGQYKLIQSCAEYSIFGHFATGSSNVLLRLHIGLHQSLSTIRMEVNSDAVLYRNL